MKNNSLPHLAIVLLSLALSACNINRTYGYKELSVKNQRQNLKDYALCSCLKLAANSDSLKNDISFSILNELSDYNAEALNKIDSLSKIVVAEIQPSQIVDYEGKKPYLLSCIEYYRSKRLDSLIKVLPLRQVIN